LDERLKTRPKKKKKKKTRRTKLDKLERPGRVDDVGAVLGIELLLDLLEIRKALSLWIRLFAQTHVRHTKLDKETRVSRRRVSQQSRVWALLLLEDKLARLYGQTRLRLRRQALANGLCLLLVLGHLVLDLQHRPSVGYVKSVCVYRLVFHGRRQLGRHRERWVSKNSKIDDLRVDVYHQSVSHTGNPCQQHHFSPLPVAFVPCSVAAASQSVLVRPASV